MQHTSCQSDQFTRKPIKRTKGTGQTPQDTTVPIFNHAIESLQIAKQAYEAGNKSGALDEAHEAFTYLQMIGLPKNCIIDNNQVLQCRFPR